MIRNILFSFFFFLGIILICVIYIPALVLPKFVVLSGGKMMGYWSGICLRVFLSTKIIIKGKENLIKNENFFIASSHQSMFETFFLQTIFNSPIFILKKELLKIPLFGLYLKKIGSISIDRDKATKENLKFFGKIKKSISENKRPLIIFPQGTRSLPEERLPFKKGAGRIYEELKIKCQPVAINSGNVWPKYGKMSSNKCITISILQPIDYGMDKDSFVKKLQNNIYSELDNLS